MPDAAPPRPPSLTMACLLIALVSVLLLLDVVAVLGSWTSLATQEGLRSYLRPLGLRGDDLAQALGVLKVLLFLAVPLTVSGAVLAVYAMRGHEVSRILVTGVAAVGFLFLAGLGLGGILSAAMLGFGVVSLWSVDARRWFAVKNGRPAPVAAGRPQPPGAPARPDPFAPQPPSGQPPSGQPPSGQPPSDQPTSTLPAAAGHPTAPVHPAATRMRGPDDRPRSVLVSAGLTVAGSLGAIAFGLLFVGLSTVGAGAMRRSVRESAFLRDYLRTVGLTVDDLVAIYLGLGVGLAVLGLLGTAAGGLLLARRRAGLHGVRVLSVVTVVVSALTIPFGLVTGAAAIYVLVQLLKPEVVAWFTRPGPPPPTRG
ncbi:MAG: hypothetical protein PGN07_04040 [Aeromicrobium erythreum]